MWYDHDVRPRCGSRRGTVCLALSGEPAFENKSFSCSAESILECQFQVLLARQSKLAEAVPLFAKAAEIWGQTPGTEKRLMVKALESQAAMLVAQVEEALALEVRFVFRSG